MMNFEETFIKIFAQAYNEISICNIPQNESIPFVSKNDSKPMIDNKPSNKIYTQKNSNNNGNIYINYDFSHNQKFDNDNISNSNFYTPNMINFEINNDQRFYKEKLNFAENKINNKEKNVSRSSLINNFKKSTFYNKILNISVEFANRKIIRPQLCNNKDENKTKSSRLMKKKMNKNNINFFLHDLKKENNKKNIHFSNIHDPFNFNLNKIEKSINNLTTPLKINNNKDSIEKDFSLLQKNIIKKNVVEDISQIKQNIYNPNDIEDVLSYYIFSNWNFQTQNKNLLNLKMALLFLTFINLNKLEYIRTFNTIGLDYNKKVSFPFEIICFFFPEIANDFVNFCLELSFYNFINKKNLYSFIVEFSHLINEENLFYFILEPII